MWRRTKIAIGLVLLVSTLAVGTAWAAFGYSSYTGPTILQVNNDGTWNLQWTIDVTTLTSPSHRVCVAVTLPGGARYQSQCGTTTGTLTCTLNNVPNSVYGSWSIDGYAGNCNSSSRKELGPSGTFSPLAVTLAEFSATQSDDHIQVLWETVSELDNRGFNLYRGTSPAGPDRQLNATLIPSQSQGNPGGFIYTWDDAADLVPGTTYYYWLRPWISSARYAERPGQRRLHRTDCGHGQ